MGSGAGDRGGARAHTGGLFPSQEDSEEETDPGGDSAEAQGHTEKHDPGLYQRVP